jgi:hypothetical protein
MCIVHSSCFTRMQTVMWWCHVVVGLLLRLLALLCNPDVSLTPLNPRWAAICDVTYYLLLFPSVVPGLAGALSRLQPSQDVHCAVKLHYILVLHDCRQSPTCIGGLLPAGPSAKRKTPLCCVTAGTSWQHCWPHPHCSALPTWQQQQSCWQGHVLLLGAQALLAMQRASQHYVRGP